MHAYGVLVFSVLDRSGCAGLLFPLSMLMSIVGRLGVPWGSLGCPVVFPCGPWGFPESPLGPWKPLGGSLEASCAKTLHLCNIIRVPWIYIYIYVCICVFCFLCRAPPTLYLKVHYYAMLCTPSCDRISMLKSYRLRRGDRDRDELLDGAALSTKTTRPCRKITIEHTADALIVASRWYIAGCNRVGPRWD